MPTIEITQAEQQRLSEIIRQDLIELEDRSDGLREMVRDIAANAEYLGWNKEKKRNLQKSCHSEIKKINGRIAKRVALLKKIKQA